jgi:hypothetical protein
MRKARAHLTITHGARLGQASVGVRPQTLRLMVAAFVVALSWIDRLLGWHVTWEAQR